MDLCAIMNNLSVAEDDLGDDIEDETATHDSSDDFFDEFDDEGPAHLTDTTIPLHLRLTQYAQRADFRASITIPLAMACHPEGFQLMRLVCFEPICRAVGRLASRGDFARLMSLPLKKRWFLLIVAYEIMGLEADKIEPGEEGALLLSAAAILGAIVVQNVTGLALRPGEDLEGWAAVGRDDVEGSGVEGGRLPRRADTV